MAVAAGDSDVLESLPAELAHAFTHAEIFGQIIRGCSGEADASLTVLSRPGEVWTFAQSEVDDTQVAVRRVTSSALRQQIHELWP